MTIFLLKREEIGDFERKLVGAGALRLSEPLDGVFVPMMSGGREPGWVDEVRAVVDGGLPNALTSQSPAGLLVVRRAGRTFVVTFGHAWQKLDDNWLEREFGRRVALNAIRPSNLIEIRAEQVFAKWHLASERAPRAASVREFGVEFDRDLVAAVEGVLRTLPSAWSSAEEQVFDSIFHCLNLTRS